jgi:transaldolase
METTDGRQKVEMNRLQRITELGQSIWYDNISRGVILRGELQAMVDEGCRGVTSNPTIFDKAISGSTDYDEQLKELLRRDPGLDAGAIITALMVTDIGMACDILRPVYDRTQGRDGFVSIEVTPSKARNTAATIEEVRSLWGRINRPNVMVKIPATKEGLPAIEEAIGDGININVTLIFSEVRYREVVEAYIRGLERRNTSGLPLTTVASVASVFVSRIDTLVDDLLQKAMDSDPARAGALLRLQGKAAVANSRTIYQAFKEIMATPRWAALAGNGAKVQRPLWGSTGTKNPAYSDLLYVDTLIGPDTVNTVPPATYLAILNHGTPALTVERDLDEARSGLRALKEAGIDMTWVLRKLEEDGVAAFEKSFDSLYANIQKKCLTAVHA